jgi:hypothetical protein
MFCSLVIGPQIALSYAVVNCPSPPLRDREVIRMLKKVIGWAIVIFIVYYLATDPTGAANFVHHIWNGLKTAASSMATFVNSL